MLNQPRNGWMTEEERRKKLLKEITTNWKTEGFIYGFKQEAAGTVNFITSAINFLNKVKNKDAFQIPAIRVKAPEQPMFEMNRRVFQANQFNGRIGFEALAGYATAGATEVFNALKAPKVISEVDSVIEGTSNLKTGIGEAPIKSGDFVDYMDAAEAQRYRDYWSKVYMKDSPVEIPENARIKAELKNSGSDQFQYKWNDGTYKWDVRWHTRTPNAPPNQETTWVVMRETSGQGAVKPYSEFFLQDNTWAKGFDWYEAIRTRKLGTATSQQVELLDKGHWPWPQK